MRINSELFRIFIAPTIPVVLKLEKYSNMNRTRNTIEAIVPPITVIRIVRK
jgi:hypothetical protein